MGPYCIDTQVISVSKKDYQSILHYLIESKLKKDSKVACFQILMQQGASLLTCNQDGLPWAHFLLSPTNECTQALYSKIPTDILHSRAFYKQLIVLLSPQNSNPKINTALVDYAKLYSSFVSLETDTDLRMQQLISGALSRQSDAKEQLGVDFLNDVKMSSEIQSLHAMLEYSILECKNIMTKEQWIKIGASAKTSQQDLLKSGLVKQIGEQGFLAAKASLTTYYHDTIEYWKNLTLVIQLNQTHASKSGPPSKALKRAINQSNKLVQSLKQYEEKYNIQKDLQTSTLIKLQHKVKENLTAIYATLNIAYEAIAGGTRALIDTPQQDFTLPPEAQELLEEAQELFESFKLLTKNTLEFQLRIDSIENEPVLKQEQQGSLKPRSKR